MRRNEEWHGGRMSGFVLAKVGRNGMERERVRRNGMKREIVEIIDIKVWERVGGNGSEWEGIEGNGKE